MLNNHYKNIAAFVHLSSFSRFLIPLGNFLGPLILWLLNKDKSEFIDQHGKQAVNFQLSMLLYTIVIGTISIPFFFINLFHGFDFNEFHHFSFSTNKAFPLMFIGGGLGIIAVVGFLFEFVLVIMASLKAKDGMSFKYPLTINFIK
ncbi:DUF4870 domain-containing protein [Wenyingzhuangia sp. chi5]|uniref:DUF4870 domain-containing protein n=1 Tax=Wenyingzhuangia gilva TaxID=3057677 RepID=A0ABT8VNN5_9FLAO|nr:DUF4870 domain-containing protein [Wenyingzhuangia sp. chi5]MDO3693572.1 DUF4870 domain-containing protein [Wenyingzhuangia sp. chi5]